MADERGTLIRFDNVKESDRVLNEFPDWQKFTEDAQEGTLEGVSDNGVLRTNLSREQIEPLLRKSKVTGYRFEDVGEPTSFGEDEPIRFDTARVPDVNESGESQEGNAGTLGEDMFTSSNVRRNRRASATENETTQDE